MAFGRLIQEAQNNPGRRAAREREKRGWDPRGMTKRWGVGADESLKRGDEGIGTALGRLTSFDAREGLNEWAGTAWNKTVGNLEDLAGASVGSGRLNTGFYDEDRGDVIGEFSEALAGRSMEAMRMQQDATAQLMGYGQSERDRYFDLLAAERERVEGQKEARRNRRSATIGAAIGAVGSGVGAYFGSR